MAATTAPASPEDLQDDEKLLLMLYTNVKRAIAPLAAAATPFDPMAPQTGHLLHLLAFLILDDKSHDQTLFLTQGQAQPPVDDGTLGWRRLAQPPTKDIKELAVRCDAALTQAMQKGMTLGARAQVRPLPSLFLSISPSVVFIHLPIHRK